MKRNEPDDREKARARMFTIQPLKVGEFHGEPGPKMFYLSEWDKTFTTAFYFWYIEGAGTRILMDVGFNSEECLMPGMVQPPEWRVEARLAQIGVDPRLIEHIIVSHLHFDHLSSTIDLFPNARLYLQRKEYNTARNPVHPWFAAFYLPGIIKRLDSDLRPRLELLDGDAEILPGLRLIWAGGHTPGLQVVYLPTRLGRTTCLTSDLCILYRHVEEDIPIGVCSSLVEVYQAMARIRREADAIIPNHDPRLEREFPINERPAD
jgi:N-acyl homoserine lactone hydrolase